MATVLAVGGALTSCSSPSTDPFTRPSEAPGIIVAGRVVADDPAFDPAAARRPRFVPCQGLSGCARTSPVDGDYYPGLNLPPTVDTEVDFDSQAILYLVGAKFVSATLEDDTVHVRLEPRLTGFQMVKLDGREILTVPVIRYSFERGTDVLCVSGLEGCG